MRRSSWPGSCSSKAIRTPRRCSRAQSLKDMFQADLNDEYEARRFYTESARQAMEAGDLGSAELFKRIGLDEEGHIDWLESQLALLEKLGEAGFYHLYVRPEKEGEEG
jgi:bacterioferritin